ncbi:MAG: ABC transporter substrate-binding protein [Rubrivivax sp.]
MHHYPTPRRRALQTLAAGAAALALPAARAQGTTKMVFGFTAVADFATLFIAAEEGMFAKRRLEVVPQLIPLNSTIPAALQSDSIQLGGPTPSVYLQAVDGGLDHVVLAGGGLTSKSATNVGFVARKDSGIKTAADCVGRRIGVPGLGAFLHVTFRAWLKQSGVDHRKVNFVEAAFPQHGDLLRGGTIDGVVTGDPFMARIVDSGVGYVAALYMATLPEGQPNLLYTARRDWAGANAAAARAFQAAIQEAAAFLVQPANADKARAAMGKYIKLPPEVLAKTQFSPPAPVISEAQLSYWADLMVEQGMLKAAPPVGKLLFK